MGHQQQASQEGFEENGSDTCAVPEHRLMLAVLEDAMVTFRRGVLSPVPKRRRLVREVEEWMHDACDDGPFAFETICSTLGIDPDYLRAGLLQMKRRAMLERRAPRQVRIRIARTNVAATGRLR